jgi:tetratricopeptide (TPR) repeat protein
MAGDIFVGREHELEALQQFLAKAAAAKTQIAFVAGEAGAGKSTLVTEFVRRAEAADPTVVAAIGECNAQTGAGDAYLPFRHVLTILSGAQDEKETGNAVTATNAARLKELVRVSGETLLDIGPDLVGIFVPGAALFTKLATRAATNSQLASKLAERMGKSEKGAASPAPNPQLDQEKIFQQYAEVVQALAHEHTLILILDDLQWADSASLNLLFHLARQLKESRVLLLGTYRPDDVALGRGGERHPLEPILNELKRYYGEIVIDLGAAQATEGRAFVEALVDAEPNRLDASFRNELFARTEGHPLFTVELLRNLQERGDLVQDAEGRWIPSATLDWAALPARVEGVIAERLARLEENLRETLNIGSVIGYDFAAQVVARVQQVQERELLKNLARELEKRHHLVLEQGETKVGKQFLSQYRFIHALFQQFLYNELGSGERRMMHGEVAEALEQLYGEHADEIAAQLARHYQEAGDDEKAATYLIRSGEAAQGAYANAEAGGFYARALEALKRLPDTTANRRQRVDTLVKQVAVALRSDGPDVNLERLKEAESLLRSLPPVEGDRERLAYIQYWTGHAYVHRGQPAAAIGYMRQVLAAAQEGVGGPELLAIPASVIGRAHLVKGQFSEAEALLAQAFEPLEKAANWHEWILAVGVRAECLAAQGQVQPAFEEAERALRKAEETGTLVGIAQSHLALAIVSWQSGEYERMRVEAYQAVQTSEKGGDRFLTASGLGLASWSEALLGNIDTAEELSLRSLSMGATIGPRLVLADWFAAARAEMALLGGRLDDAQARAREAVDLAHEVGSRFSEGLAERVWGRALAQAPAADWTEAEAHLAASLQAFEVAGALLEGARTHVAWGQVLQRRGNPQAAREHFEKAAAQFQVSELASELEQTKQLFNS